jgi:hypothetical protein
VGTFTNGDFSTISKQKDMSETSNLFENPKEKGLGSANKKGF